MNEDRPLAGDVAVVTGASSGIGAATARHLAEAGANVVLAARSEGELDALADDVEGEYDVRARAVPTDVTERGQVDALVEATVEAFGGLDVLVNNAGLGLGGDVETMTDEQYHTMTDVNVDGMFYATRAALPHVRESRGTLVFVGSLAGQYPRPGNPVYAATKWWVRGFALSVQARVGTEDVGVSVINPSEVRTAFGSEEGTSQAERFDPGSVTEPSAVADAVVFAASQDGDTVSELDLYRRDKLADTIT
jgi:NADP-dependent 3-hydroxy acid dehydrogenase YdfG